MLRDATVRRAATLLQKARGIGRDEALVRARLALAGQASQDTAIIGIPTKRAHYNRSLRARRRSAKQCAECGQASRHYRCLICAEKHKLCKAGYRATVITTTTTHTLDPFAKSTR